jgi:hypothetical protein
MLSRRLIAATARKRIGGLSLIVRPGSRAVPLDLGDAALAPWIEREKAALAPPPAKPPAQPSTAHAFADREFGLGQKFAALALAGAMYEPDARTPEAYEGEVNKYIETATEVLPTVLIRRAYELEMGRIDLTIRNETDDPIHQLRVELYIRAEGVMAVSEDVDLPDVSLPQRPVEFGKGGRSRFGLNGLSAFRSPYVSPVISAIGRRVTIDNSGSTRLTFDPIDLYPQESCDLDPFYLFVSSLQAGQTLPGEWTARAKDASGVLTSSVTIDVDPTVPTIDQLLADPGPGDQEPNDGT